MKTITFCVVTILCACCYSTAQEPKAKSKYVVAPPENTLLTVASQPTCPLVIEEARILLNIQTSWDFKFSYDLRNRGNKAIRSFSIYFWTSEATGGTLADKRRKLGFISPGERVSYTPTNEAVVPLTQELREKLRLNDQMKMVVILMVEQIEFADGSRFSDEKTLTSLKQYIENR
jgi:hypothetical protein